MKRSLLVALLLAALGACGGGSDLTADEAAQHDAEAASLADQWRTTQPVPCRSEERACL